MRRGPAVLVLGGALACSTAPLAPSREPWTPTRHDYFAFRARHPGVLDPNYLPFMAHRFEHPGAPEDWLVLCRWDDHRFPLRVFIEAPEVDPEIEDEFHPTDPAVYVHAVERALTSWEEALPGTVRFSRVHEPDGADLRIRLIGDVGPAPDPEVQVLGITPVARACRARDAAPEAERLEVEFQVDEVAIYVADRFGLLTADQVERITLHELGHALGMRGHSPIPADVMYEVARDRSVDRLSGQDRNSFRTLYGLPNGTVYGRLPRGVALERPRARAPEGPPVLDPEPYRDPRLGFALRLPRGWLRIETPYGVVGVDGVAWDYEASFQLIVRPYASIAEYLERYGAAHVGDGRIRANGDLEIGRMRAYRIVLERRAPALVEQHVFIESGDGRVLVAIADAPPELYEAFRPWFDAMLDSLELLPSDG